MKKAEIEDALRDANLKDLVRMQRAIPWVIGDRLSELDNFENLGLSDAQLYDFDRVARMWPIEYRKYDLPWSYYRDAGSDFEIADAVLEATERNGWSREQMRAARKLMRRGLGYE